MKSKNLLFGCGGLLLVLFLSMLGVVAYFFVYFGPRWTGPTDFAVQRQRLAASTAAASGQPVEGAGTWPVFERARDATIAAHERVMGGSLFDVSGNPRWPDVFDADVPAPDPEKARAIIAAMEVSGVFVDLDALASDPRAIAPAQDNSELVSMKSSGLDRSVVRQLIRVCSFRFREEVAAGRHDDAVKSLRRMLALARVTGAQGSMIDAFVSIACVARLCLDVRDAVHAQQLPEPAMAAMQRVVDDSAMPDLRLTIEGERLYGLASLHQTLKDSRFVMASRGASMHRLNRYYDKLLPILALDTSERRRTIVAFEREQQANLSLYPSVGTLVPTVARLFMVDDQVRLEIAATSTLLSVERARRLRGEPPAALADLGELRPKVWPDPFRPEGLIYRVDAALPRGYVLYSVGLDGVDDGATPHANANHEALRDDATGTDYVIVPPHPKGN